MSLFENLMKTYMVVRLSGNQKERSKRKGSGRAKNKNTENE